MTSTSPVPTPLRSTRSPPPSLPPPPQSAKLPPKPTASTTNHVAYSRQSLGPSSAYLSAGGSAGASLPSSAGGAGTHSQSRIVSGPAGIGGMRNGGRPSSEILGMGSGLLNAGGHLGGNTNSIGGALDARSPEAEAIDRWFQDLASYEVTLEEMAAASQDQNFTEELGAIEQWFRVLSEAERTAALYSLLQHSTGVQIRFFMTVLQQMARSDPMTALLSPAPGANSMQAQMEAKLAGLGMKSPGASKTSFAPSSPNNRDSYAGNVDPSSFLSPEAALANAGEGPAASSAGSTTSNRSKRTSAPGGLASNTLSPNNWGSGVQLDQVLERGGSPFNESERSHSRLSDGRPKSTDFSGNANANFSKSPRLSSSNNNDEMISFPLSPVGNGNWASMVNTPAMPMFPTNSHSSLDGSHSAFSAANLSGGPTVLLSDAPKRRVSASNRSGSTDNYNESHGNNNNTSSDRRGPTTPGSVGGGFQGANGSWARSPNLSSHSESMLSSNNTSNAGFPTFGLGVGIGGMGGLNTMNSPSANDIALQMSQLQLQQLQLQQLQQLQSLGVGGGMMGLGGMGLGMGGLNGMGGMTGNGMGAGGLNGFGGMGMGLPGNMQMGSSPRNGSNRSTGTGGGRKSPMVGSGSMGSKSPAQKKAEEDEETDIKLLEDIPQWLRALRLHKYTPNFEAAKWQDMVVMTDSDLEAKGVAALGARRKLLKTFENVRNQYGIAAPKDNGNNDDGAGPLANSGDEEA